MKRAVGVVFILAAFCSPSLAEEPVLSVTGGTGGWPAKDTNHGWEFTVNEPIVVTQLGLYDDSIDGMGIDYPVGIFRLSDSQLITSGTIHAGAVDTLIGNFRYSDTPDVTLDVGDTYVISFYSASSLSDFQLSTSVQGLSVSPVITLAPVARYGEEAGGLALPPNYADALFDPYRIGPNFLFTVVPEPTTFTLLGLSSLALVMGRRRW